MVRLTMTPAIVAAVEAYSILHAEPSLADDSTDPSLEKPAVGNPVAHGQIITISKRLRTLDEHLKEGERPSSPTAGPYHLDNLLQGSRIYSDSPKPKPEPVSRLPLKEVE